jgi:hypothetical protein
MRLAALGGSTPLRVSSAWVPGGSAPPVTLPRGLELAASQSRRFHGLCPCRKEELALRNQFYGKTPQEILSEDPRPHRPAAAASAESDEQQLHNQIVDEIADRQSFLDNMARLGQGHVHQQRIEGEIAERVHDLKRLEPYLQEAGNSSGGGAG